MFFFTSPTHCPQCPEVFQSLPLLTAHRLEAHGFLCEVCDWKAGSELELKQHYEEIHETVLEFSCPIKDCDDSFSSRFQLKEHLNDVHGPSNLYFCSKCNRSFITELEMTHHFRSHGRILCGLCGEAQDTSFQLSSHLKQVHKGMTEPESLA